MMMDPNRSSSSSSSSSRNTTTAVAVVVATTTCLVLTACAYLVGGMFTATTTTTTTTTSQSSSRGSSSTKKKKEKKKNQPLSNNNNNNNNTNDKIKKKKMMKVCPFSQESDFLVETAEHLPLSPLELYEDWLEEYEKEYNRKQEKEEAQEEKKEDTSTTAAATTTSTANTTTTSSKKSPPPPPPLAARWLNAGLSGQDTPGMLRAGLKRLRNSKYFLVEESFRLQEELTMKQQALDDPKRHPYLFVAEKESLEAQRETLELFLEYLPKRYPQFYQVDANRNTIEVIFPQKNNNNKTTFRIKDYADRPLELCERIVQEDLVLMRPPQPPSKDDDDEETTTNHDGRQFVMSAAAVVFSFNELQEKLGKPVDWIHAPVPGYAKHLRKTLDMTFSKLLKVEAPMWRNNWGIAPTGRLDEPLYGSVEAQAQRDMSSSTSSSQDNMDNNNNNNNNSNDIANSKYLKVEYQTIRRLPRTGYLLFTVKTMADPMSSLEQVPKAASCLASSIEGMSQAMRKYKGIQDEETCRRILTYLHSISSSSSPSSSSSTTTTS